jgi:hypothetical protein
MQVLFELFLPLLISSDINLLYQPRRSTVVHAQLYSYLPACAARLN